MIPLPPRSNRTDNLCPFTTAFRSRRQWRREDRAGIDGGHLVNSKTVREAIASRRYSELRCAGPPQLSALSHVRDIALFRPEPGMKYSLLLLIGCLLSIPAQASDPAVQKLQARIAADPYPEYLEIGRAHVRTPVTNAILVSRVLLENNKATT